MSSDNKFDGLSALTDEEIETMEDLPKLQGRSLDDVKIQMYRCGDIVFSVDAVKKMRLIKYDAYTTKYIRDTGELVVRLKDEYLPEKNYAMSSKRDGKNLCLQTGTKLREIDKTPPSECIELDFEWIPNNNVIEIDLTDVPRY